jgi:hypothetical protein
MRDMRGETATFFLAVLWLVVALSFSHSFLLCV